jgi:hypothetical protein
MSGICLSGNTVIEPCPGVLGYMTVTLIITISPYSSSPV